MVAECGAGPGWTDSQTHHGDTEGTQTTLMTPGSSPRPAATDHSSPPCAGQEPAAGSKVSSLHPMRVADKFRGPNPVISFEFFPTKSEEGRRKLLATIEHLAELEPDFVSVTYGAGGGTRDLTVEIATEIKRTIGLEAVVHLTCTGHTAQDLEGVLAKVEASGIENVLALRGDPPKGEIRYVAPDGGFNYADELVRFIRPRHRFCVGAACYPEGHTEAPDPHSDLQNLVKKVESGVDFLISQLFFDNSLYFDFVRRARRAGITVPIMAGIMPVTNVAQIERFTTICGATIPGELRVKLEKVRNDDQAVMAIGIEWALRQCRELLAEGAPGIHFYTLNKSLATRIVHLGLKDSLAARRKEMCDA